jgi:hypothetical protein
MTNQFCARSVIHVYIRAEKTVIIPATVHFVQFKLVFITDSLTMAPLIVRATYTEQNALEKFLVEIFGRGTVTVIVRVFFQRTCEFADFLVEARPISM